MARKFYIPALTILTIFLTSMILFNQTGKNVVTDTKSIQNLQYGKLTVCPTVFEHYTASSCDGNASIPFLEFLYPWKIITSEFEYIQGGNTINIKEMVRKVYNRKTITTLDYYIMDPEAADLDPKDIKDLDCGFCYIYTTYKLFMSQINDKRDPNFYLTVSKEHKQKWMDFNTDCMNRNLNQSNCSGGDYINAFNSLIRITRQMIISNMNVYMQFSHRFLSKKTFKDYITPYVQPRVMSGGIEVYTPIRFDLGILVDNMRLPNKFSDLNFGPIAIQLCLDTLRKINNSDSSDMYTCIKEADFGYKKEEDIYKGCKKPHVAVLVSVKNSSDNYLLQFAHQWRKNQTAQIFGSYFYIAVPIKATSGIETVNPCRIALGKSVQVTDDGFSLDKPPYKMTNGEFCPEYKSSIKYPYRENYILS